jgi:hypothetical protein
VYILCVSFRRQPFTHVVADFIIKTTHQQTATERIDLLDSRMRLSIA